AGGFGPGAVHNGVEPTECVECGADHVRALALVADICVAGSDDPAEFGRRLLYHAADVDGEHLGALADEHLDTSPADAAACPGDDRDLAFEQAGHARDPSAVTPA